MFSLPFNFYFQLISARRSVLISLSAVVLGRHCFRHDKFLRPWHHNVFFRGLFANLVSIPYFRLLFSVILSMKCIVLHSSRLLSVSLEGLSCYLRNLSSELFVPIYYFFRVQRSHTRIGGEITEKNPISNPSVQFFPEFIFYFVDFFLAEIEKINLYCACCMRS